MVFYTELKLMESVNIFTDTSTSQIKVKNKNILINSLGMLVSYGSNIPCQSIKILVDEHNVFGEIKAIELAVMWCITHANPTFPYYYNIFTDSQTSVESINGYLSNYFTNNPSLSEPGNSKSKVFSILNSNSIDKKKTNFDNVAKIISYLIITNRIPIRIIYTPAHVDLEKNKEGELKRAINKFQINNKYFHFPINRNEIYLLLSGNHAIDYLTRSYLLNNLEFIQNDVERTSDYIQYGIRRDIPLVWPYSFYDRDNFFIAGYASNNSNLVFDEIIPVPPFTIPQLLIY